MVLNPATPTDVYFPKEYFEQAIQIRPSLQKSLNEISKTYTIKLTDWSNQMVQRIPHLMGMLSRSSSMLSHAQQLMTQPMFLTRH
jgi:hypothetical protein